ncbi:rhodanese-like domain-containing protein [Pseudaestuariivita atlantica]|nr:rhodanese-like domain-containing protein [Pseudaestuariivita atlantica]
MVDMTAEHRTTIPRRAFLAGASGAAVLAPFAASAQEADIWSAARAREAMQADTVRLIDIRSREEWEETGIAQGAWPISLHEPRFAERLFAARMAADGRPVAIICATGGRSGFVLRQLREAGYGGFIDVSEGMLGSARGPGWIAAGLPVVTLDEALAVLPANLL